MASTNHAGTSVALTGASGLVGSQIAAQLRDLGCNLRCGLRASSSLQWLDGITFDRVPFQLDQPNNFHRLVKDADTVIHCAAITRAARNSEYRHLNTAATIEMAHAAARAGAKRFVFVSSLAARGPDAGSGPDSAYGHSKLAAEHGLAEMTDHDDMDIICLRLGGVYGPRDTDLLPLFRMAAKGFATLPPRKQLLQPLFGEDAAAAVVAACFCPPTPIPLNVCETGVYSWKQVAGYMHSLQDKRMTIAHLPSSFFVIAAGLSDSWSRLRGAAPQLDLRRGRDIAVNTWTCSTNVAERVLNWRAQTPLRQGLERTWNWYQEQGWLE